MIQRIALTGAVIAVLLAAGPSAMAVPVAADAVAEQIVQERAALARAMNQSREAELRAERMATEARAMQSAGERDRAELAALALRIQAAEADLAAGRARSAIFVRLLAQQRQRLAVQQRPVAELVAALQLLTRRPPITLFAQPGAARDLVHARAMIEAVMPELQRRTAGLRSELARSRALIAARGRSDARLADATEQLAQRRSELARSEAQRRTRASGLASSAGLEGDRAIALGQDAGDIGGLLERLEDAGSVRDRLARLAGPVPRPGSVNGGGGAVAAIGAALSRPAYRLPVVGRIITGYGEVSREGTRSRGLTIATTPGAQVVAPARGRIVYAGPFRTYGRIVIVDHGGGWTSLITDMVAVSVDVGQNVDQGSPIGRTGPDRPRITMELRRAGQPIDIATLVV